MGPRILTLTLLLATSFLNHKPPIFYNVRVKTSLHIPCLCLMSGGKELITVPSDVKGLIFTLTFKL